MREVKLKPKNLKYQLTVTVDFCYDLIYFYSFGKLKFSSDISDLNGKSNFYIFNGKINDNSDPMAFASYVTYLLYII